MHQFLKIWECKKKSSRVFCLEMALMMTRNLRQRNLSVLVLVFSINMKWETFEKY